MEEEQQQISKINLNNGQPEYITFEDTNKLNKGDPFSKKLEMKSNPFERSQKSDDGEPILPTAPRLKNP